MLFATSAAFQSCHHSFHHYHHYHHRHHHHHHHHHHNYCKNMSGRVSCVCGGVKIQLHHPSPLLRFSNSKCFFSSLGIKDQKCHVARVLLSCLIIISVFSFYFKVALWLLRLPTGASQKRINDTLENLLDIQKSLESQLIGDQLTGDWGGGWFFDKH